MVRLALGQWGPLPAPLRSIDGNLSRYEVIGGVLCACVCVYGQANLWWVTGSALSPMGYVKSTDVIVIPRVISRHPRVNLHDGGQLRSTRVNWNS